MQQEQSVNFARILYLETIFKTKISNTNKSKLKGIRRFPFRKTSQDYDERRALGDILAGNIQKAFELDVTYRQRRMGGDLYTLKSQSGTIDDLFHNELLTNCSFYPTGERRSDAPLLLVDPYWIMINRTKTDYQGKATKDAVSLAFFGYDEGKKGLIVDGIAGRSETIGRGWFRDFRLAHEHFAQDNGCEFVMYGDCAQNKLPQEFAQILREQRNLGVKEVNGQIFKAGGFEHIKKYGAHEMLIESFKEQGKKPQDIYFGLRYEISRML